MGLWDFLGFYVCEVNFFLFCQCLIVGGLEEKYKEAHIAISHSGEFPS